MTERCADHRPSVSLVEDEEDCRRLWRMLLDGDDRFGTPSSAVVLNRVRWLDVNHC